MEAPKEIYIREYIRPYGTNSFDENWQEISIASEGVKVIKYIRWDTLPVDNQIIYLSLRPHNLINDLSINEWNKFISSYENDNDAIVEDYKGGKYDGFVFITTNLYNILKHHSILDLRFNVGYRTEGHTTDYKL